MDKKLYILASVMTTSFIIMILLIASPYSELHYLPETVLMFSAGCFCAQLCEDEDTLGLGMVLPVVILFALGGLLIPVCLLLVAFYYSGLFLAIGGETHE